MGQHFWAGWIRLCRKITNQRNCAEKPKNQGFSNIRLSGYLSTKPKQLEKMRKAVIMKNKKGVFQWI